MLLDEKGNIDHYDGGRGSNGHGHEARRPANHVATSKKSEEEFWLWAVGGTVAAVGLVGVGWMAIDNMNKQRLAQQQMAAAAQQNSVQQQREKEMHDAQPQSQPQAQQQADIPSAYSDSQVNTGDYSDTNAAVQNTVTPEPEPVVKELEEEDPDSIISTYAPRF